MFFPFINNSFMEKKNQQMNTNESNIRNMLASLLYMKKTNSKQSKEIIKKISSLTSKEKLYQSLRIELNYLKELNNYYKNYFKIVEEKRKEVEKNHRKVNRLLEQRKKSMNGFFEFSEGCDDQKISIQVDKEVIKNDNTKIIALKKKEQSKLKEQLKEIEDKTNSQKGKIEVIMNKVKELDTKRNNEYNSYFLNEKTALQKIQNFEKGIKVYTSKYSELHNQVFNPSIEINETQKNTENNDVIEELCM